VPQNKSYTLDELAGLLDAKLIGDGQCEIHGLGTLANAGVGQLSFLSNPAYIDQLAGTQASAVIIEEKFASSCPANKLIAHDPYVCFARATRLFDTTPSAAPGIHPSAVIDPSARLAASVSVGANAVIEANVSIGEGSQIGAGAVIGQHCVLGANCKLYSSVTLYHGVKLGANVIIHSGAVIGADGFGFAFDGTRSIKIHQLGGVTIGDDVDIGAGTTIDRGAIDDTVIGNGVKIDNQVQIGHNCTIGEHTIICGCAAIAGSVTIGKYCIMGGASGAVGHITIADKVQVSAMSLVSKSITEPGMYSSGTGHMKTSEWKRNIVRFQQLDSIVRRLKEIEKSNDKN
jgi:UDP-3-O-[3-hydroxymyristoyl] glucosamine N-acyltransferase